MFPAIEGPGPGPVGWLFAERRVPAAVIVAVGGALLALTIRLAMTPIMEDRVAFLFFMPAVVLAAALGGLWPGVLATVLGVAGGLFITWNEQLTGDLASAAVFVVIGLGVSAGGEMFQSMRAQAAAVNAGLRAREAHLSSILATVPDAMVVIDERGEMHSFSHAAERLPHRVQQGVAEQRLFDDLGAGLSRLLP